MLYTQKRKDQQAGQGPLEDSDEPTPPKNEAGAPTIGSAEPQSPARKIREQTAPQRKGLSTEKPSREILPSIMQPISLNPSKYMPNPMPQLKHPTRRVDNNNPGLFQAFQAPFIRRRNSVKSPSMMIVKKSGASGSNKKKLISKEVTGLPGPLKAEEQASQESLKAQLTEFWSLVDESVVNREYFHGYFTKHYLAKILQLPGDYVCGIVPVITEQKGLRLEGGIGLYVGYQDIRFVPIRFSEVYIASLLENGRRSEVAAKIFKPSTLSLDPNANRTKDITQHKMFLDEAYVMWQLNHPNIVQFYGICSLSPALTIVMECCKGGSVRSYLQKHGEGVGFAVKTRFAIEACEGLGYLARRDFVHRDVAARNCLLTEQLVLKVADFGLTVDVDSLRRREHEQNGMVLPIKWASPEVLRSGEFSWASDVWAYGVMLFEFYNEGREPYPGLRNRVVREELLKGQQFRMELPNNIPPPIRGLMAKCWAEEPLKRPSFSVLADELDKIRRGVYEEHTS
ncbi:unnamed protein product, partial [Mesorhabditis spiculigera]